MRIKKKKKKLFLNSQQVCTCQLTHNATNTDAKMNDPRSFGNKDSRKEKIKVAMN